MYNKIFPTNIKCFTQWNKKEQQQLRPKTHYPAHYIRNNTNTFRHKQQQKIKRQKTKKYLLIWKASFIKSLRKIHVKNCSMMFLWWSIFKRWFFYDSWSMSKWCRTNTYSEREIICWNHQSFKSKFIINNSSIIWTSYQQWTGVKTSKVILILLLVFIYFWWLLFHCFLLLSAMCSIKAKAIKIASSTYIAASSKSIFLFLQYLI